MLNDELSQKLAHGEVGLSLPGFMISIKQSTPTSKPRYPQSSTASPQPIHNLSVSPQTPLATKRGGGGQRDGPLSGVHTRCASIAQMRQVVMENPSDEVVGVFQHGPKGVSYKMSAVVANLGTIEPLTSRTVVLKPRLDFRSSSAAQSSA